MLHQRMKWHLLLVFFCVGLTSRAQSSSPTHLVRGYVFYGSPTRYASLADTATPQTPNLPNYSARRSRLFG